MSRLEYRLPWEVLTSFTRPFRSRRSIERYQAVALRRLIDHASKHVPFYRRKFELHGLGPGDIRVPADLERLPPVSRRELQEAAIADRMATGVVLSKCVSHETAGSSGEPLRIVRTPREEAILFGRRLRAQMLSGLRPWHRRVAIGMPPTAFVWHRIGLFRVQTVDYALDPREVLDQVVALDPNVLKVTPETLEQLLEQPADQRRPRPHQIFTGANQLRASLRRRAESALGARITDFYGATEANLIAWECHRCGRYHTVDDAVLVEVVGQDGRPAAPGEEGEVLLTALHSFAMPFIRFRIGDLARRPIAPTYCAVHFDTLERIQGRTIDYLRFAGGRRLSPFRLLDVFDGVPGLGCWQAVQHSETRITIEFELLPGAVAVSVGNAIEAHCRAEFPPDVEVEVREVQGLDEEAGTRAGAKHRYVRSAAPEESS